MSAKIPSLRACIACCILTLSSLHAAKPPVVSTPALSTVEGSKPPVVSLSKPNIILILADDLGYGDLGCYGANYPTPALDQMAAEGFRSTDMISAANVCSPSRSALLTGRYPMRNGHPYYRSDYHTKSGGCYGLHPDEITLAELLKPAGYRSFAVGKWHLGFEMEGAHPMDAGFDTYYGLPHNYGGKVHATARALIRDHEVLSMKVPFQKITPSYNEEVVKFINEHPKDPSTGSGQGQPFFIYMAHQIAHSPVLPNKAFMKKSKKAKYAAFVSELDDSVGQMLQALRDNDLEENTLVIFLADNGQAGSGTAGPLSGSKYTTMEGGHRVAGIFRWTGTIPAGQVSDTTLSSMDIFPLVADLAGVELPTDRKIDGANIRDILMGASDESPHEYLYYYNGLNLQAVRKGKWKLHLPRTLEDLPYWGKAGKARRFITLDEPFLVNLETDIAEMHNVAANNPEVVTTLLKEASRIRAELGEVGQQGADQRPGWPAVN
ncbi:MULTISPECIES: sulfatase-like hydrolase/transferase [unclassified Lentimonas]|uniref:sulfatase-like hydrolase/transferase n=1 Tax=unclassified Lentimonas TaxID=2630993 RepID=UPI001FD4A1B0|nr:MULTISPECIES: sulfatase-like hydrolase/transferase [unclassified Lentimonas]